MKLIHDRVIDTASDRKSSNPVLDLGGRGSWGRELRRSLVASRTDMLLTHFLLTFPTPLCSPGADFSDSLLHPNSVDTAAELGWSELSNGDLIAAAEREGYNIFITTDQNLRYQQNLLERKISIIVLTTTSWPRIKKGIDNVLSAIDSLSETNYIEVLFE